MMYLPENSSNGNKMQLLTSPLIILFHTVGVLSTINCPLNETEWKARSYTKNCQGSDAYHCLLLEDGKTREEKCIEKTLIKEGNCPILTHDDYLHWKKCNTTGCPRMPFRSDEVYKYPLCYGNIESEDKNNLGNEKLREDSDDIIPILTALGVALIVLVMAAAALFVVIKRRKYGPAKNGNHESESVSLMDTENSANVTDCLGLLKNRNVLYLFGQLGNSVSTTGKAVAKKYAKDHKLKDVHYNYLDIPKKFPDNHIFFIDGWCGLWNENPCEKKSTINEIVNIVQQSNVGKKMKFVIGLRTEIKEKYQTELRNWKILLKKNEKYDLDNITPEIISTVSDKIKLLRESCDRGDFCKCRSLDVSMITDIESVPIGFYLIMDLLFLDHDLIPDFTNKNKGPLVAMQNHFERLLDDESVRFPLIYIILVGHYDETEFRQEIGEAFGFSNSDVSSSTKIRKYTKVIRKCDLSPMWSQRIKGEASKSPNESQEIYVFRHNFLYICAFHACYRKYPSEIMSYCNLDAVLQLVRPKKRNDASDPFTIQADDQFVNMFCEKRVSGHANESPWTEHPLIQEWKNRKAK